VARTHEVFGPIDILINNAAAFGMASALTMPVTRYRLCFEVNVFAPYRLMQLVLPDMVEKQGGHIVNISSDASRRPPPGPYRDGQLAAGGAAYGASKFALEHLTRSIAAEFSSRGVAVNAVMPSLPIATQSVLEAVPDTTEFGSLSDFVKAVMMLANADPSELNGGVWYSEDLRHPDRAPRGWLGSL
jgi:NAD(P)-dependent dehydrogenase (short-subunit alcohol dehydrogenase family)